MQIFEFGSKDGIPLVLFFGTPQRGDVGAELDALASAHGIRLICPTRPWYDDRSVAPCFEAVTAPVLAYLQRQGLACVHAAGGSGGGPFALHLALRGGAIVDCTLLASMGLPASFLRHVTSPPTIALLQAFEARDLADWTAKFAAWGLPADIAYGAWGDFVAFFDDLPQLDRTLDKPVHVHHGQADPNAPLESVRELLAEASDVRWHIDDAADHIAMANDDSGQVFARIFASIKERAQAA